MNVLITGNAGLIGSRMCDWILNNIKDCTVVGIDDLSGGYVENISEGVIFYKRDLSSDDISDIFEKHKFDYVFHFACYAAEGLSPFIRKFNYANNIGATVNVINNCITYDVKRLVYTSSMSVYGHGTCAGQRFDEDDRQNPVDPYGISKYACEMDVKVAYEQHGLDYCIIRPHNCFGIAQNIWDKYRNVLGIWMNKVLNNQDALIYGDGNQTRAFTYIDDVLPCFWKAATLDEASRQTINLGGITPHTINEAAEILKNIVENDGYTMNIVHKQPRHEVKWAVPTYQKSVDILGFEHKTELEDGLKLMWDWAKNQPKREQFKWSEYEINKGLYDYWK